MTSRTGNTTARALAAALVLAAGLATQPAGAAMYKWVDADGNTVYSQHPPPDGQARVIRPPPPPADSDAARKALQEREKRFEERQQARREAREQAQQAARAAATRKTNCEIARKRFTQLANGYQMSFYDEANNRVRIPEERRQAMMAEARAKIDEYCN